MSHAAYRIRTAELMCFYSANVKFRGVNPAWGRDLNVTIAAKGVLSGMRPVGIGE
jgi:hypothetical protein